MRRFPLPRRRLGALVTLLSLLAIARLTLTPQEGASPSAVPWWCLLCVDLAALGMLLNVALFVPFGVGMRLLGVGIGRAALLGAALSFLVELLQYRIIQGRDTSIDDLVANTLGAVLGALVVSLAPRCAAFAGRRPLLVALVSIAAWCAVLVGSSALSQPSTPVGGVFVRASPADGVAPFAGEVLEVRLDGRRLRPGESVPPRPGQPRARWLAARIVAGERGAARATIVEAVDEHEHEFLALAREENDLLATARLRSADAGLLSPTLRFRDAFRGRATDTVVVSGRYSFDGLDATICADSACRTERLDRTPGWGWRFLVPGAETFGRWPPLPNAIWVALLVAATGSIYPYLRTPSSRGILLAAVVIALGTALAAVPLGRVGRAAPPLEWLAALGGLGAGIAIGRARRRRPGEADALASREQGANAAGGSPVHPAH